MRFEIINTLKREKGLTNAQLAELSGVTLSTIDKITSGVNKNPKLDTLLAICDVLGCTLNDFLDIKNSPDTAEAVPEEAVSDLLEYLRKGLISLGFLEDGRDITDKQADILIAVCHIIRAAFEDGE